MTGGHLSCEPSNFKWLKVPLGASVVVQPPAMPASHMGAGLCPGYSTSIQQPAGCLGKLAEGGPCGWAIVTHVEDLDETPGS